LIKPCFFNSRVKHTFAVSGRTSHQLTTTIQDSVVALNLLELFDVDERQHKDHEGGDRRVAVGDRAFNVPGDTVRYLEVEVVAEACFHDLVFALWHLLELLKGSFLVADWAHKVWIIVLLLRHSWIFLVNLN
jgi:hypothetical protein